MIKLNDLKKAVTAAVESSGLLVESVDVYCIITFKEGRRVECKAVTDRHGELAWEIVRELLPVQDSQWAADVDEDILKKIDESGRRL